MRDYSQPDFYHFSEDSTQLAQMAVKLTGQTPINRVLDLCCGCGVVGMEYLLESEKRATLTGVEMQVEFSEHFEENAKRFGLQDRVSFENCDIKIFNPALKYDLILANPPYFLEGSGRASQNLQKQKCRFWSEYEAKSFVKKIGKYLSPRGSAFISLREGPFHPIDESWQLIEETSGARFFLYTLLNKNGR